MADDRLAIDDMLEELRMLRHVVSEVINHCAEGGYVDRRGTLFKDLRRVHRATRDRQVELKQIWPELDAAPWYREADPRYWQNLACCMAFWAGGRAGYVEGAWTAVLDSLLEAGGTEPTTFAVAMAHELGVELMESPNGGRHWVPVRAFHVQLAELPTESLRRELERRGSRFVEVRGLGDPPMRVPASGRLVVNGVPVRVSTMVPDGVGVEALVRRGANDSRELIVGPRDFDALSRAALDYRANSTLTFAGNPMRESDALLNHEGLVDDPGPYERHRPRCDVDECDERAVDGTDFCNAHQPRVQHVPPIIHHVLDGPGVTSGVTLCGAPMGHEANYSGEPEVTCNECRRRHAEMQRAPRAAAGTVSGWRDVPGGKFGYVPKP